MMQDVCMTLNPGLTQKISIQQEGSFHHQTEIKFKEETSKLLHLEHSLHGAGNLDTSENTPEIPGKY